MKNALIYILFFLMILFVSFTQSRQNTEDRAVSEYPDRIMMCFPGDPSNTIGITWRTDFSIKKALGEITEASPAPVLDNNIIKVTGKSSSWEEGRKEAMGHKVIFTGLKPDTPYVYRVGDGKKFSEWIQFKTASKTEKPFSFIYFGDVQNGIIENGSRNIRQAYAHNPGAAFMLFAGDLVNRSIDKDWQAFFHAGGYLYSQVPCIATPGNHEYYKRPENGKRPFSRHWNQIFINPSNGPFPFKNRVYFVDYQGTRIISLDSFPFILDEAESERQIEWFENVLASNSQNWTIVTFHHPVFSCSRGRDNDGLREIIKPLLEKYGVDLVLQGHDHCYCRGIYIDSIGSHGSGTPVYVVSVAGEKMYGLGPQKMPDQSASLTQLYQIIDINKNTLTFNAYTVTGDLYDSFQLIKFGRGRNLFVENAKVTDIEKRVKIPEQRLERYSKEEMRQYHKLYKQEDLLG